MSDSWRGVPGFEGRYMVSRMGQIRNRSTGKLLFGEIDRDGYRRVNLCGDGKSYKRRVHRLVCEAFHGPAPDGCEVGHLDGRRTHNAAHNLAWVTRAENVGHSKAHGTFRAPARAPKEAMRRGSANPAAKLTEEVVLEARARHANGETGRALAREYGVNSGNMSAALRGQTWAHVGNADAPNLNVSPNRSGGGDA
jgi:hypothetical protein